MEEAMQEEDYARGKHYVQVGANPHVYMVRVPFENISTSETNAYLIIDEGECLVVDTGAPSEEGEALLRAAFEELGVTEGHVSFFLTHLHLDHMGLIDAVAPVSAPLYLTRAEYDHLRHSRDAARREAYRGRFLDEGYAPEQIDRFSDPGENATLFDFEGRDMRFVSDGDCIQVGSLTFRVIDTAGHTVGHISLFHEESGLLFCGDHVLFVISPSLGFCPGNPDIMGTYLANLAKLEGMGISRLLVSHGPLRDEDDWRARVRWMIAHHQERIDEAAGVIAASSGLSGAEVIRRLKWNVPCAWEDIPDLQMWCIAESGIVVLDHLVCEGRVKRIADECGVNRYEIA